MDINYIAIFNFTQYLIYSYTCICFSRIYLCVQLIYLFYICFDFGAQGLESENISYKTFPGN